jgi:hypothetical protein
MSDLEHARERFRAISEGQYVPKEMSVDEAKKQLHAADPGIDISGFLKAVHQNDLQKAATSISIETLTDPAVIRYWSPVLVGLFQTLISAGKSKLSSKAEA